ncbi:universal stress protein [Flavisphingomonas formosensis]|uniref:universal stress protein n=1 Tax=Flavisphingomonas formosensis TaxID=861534 RepID=UPI0018E02013|nr:universal stress protein [Sphingomonas formosensis]
MPPKEMQQVNFSTAMPTAEQAVVACIDQADRATWILPHAFALARALQAPLTLMHVLDPRPAYQGRPDPVEWDIRRHEARRRLGRLSGETGESAAMGVELAEGAPAEQICGYAHANGDCPIVLGTRSQQNASSTGLGGTAYNVLLGAAGPVLLVPKDAALAAPAYHRILVPLDGSSWAESVLPMATVLAGACDAELILVHVVPTPEFTEIRPLESEDLELRQRVIQRNEATAHIYLERIRSKLASMPLRVRVISVRGEDVRSMLAMIIRDEQADLVVLSANGRGSNRHAELRFGSVSSYLMSHCTAPMLIVHPAGSQQQYPVATPTVRLPTGCLA